MTARLVISPAARQDLMDIGDFIAADNPARAVTFVAEIEARIREIAEQPQSFPERSDLYEGLRVARYRRYLIFFLDIDADVRIVRVLHGARDLPAILTP